MKHVLALGSLMLVSALGAGCAGRVDATTAQAVPQQAAAQTAAPQDAQTQGVAPMRGGLKRTPVDDTPTGAPPVVSGADAMRAIPCGVRDLVLSPRGGDNSDFSGMSHSGTYLTLTNKTRSACSIPGMPQLTFLDANGPVATNADMAGTRFMHPGPVVLPIVLKPKQSVLTSVRWVSGPVFTDNLCYKLTGVSVALREGAATTAVVGQMCGERRNGVHYELKRYGVPAS